MPPNWRGDAFGGAQVGTHPREARPSDPAAPTNGEPVSVLFDWRERLAELDRMDKAELEARATESRRKCDEIRDRLMEQKIRQLAAEIETLREENEALRQALELTQREKKAFDEVFRELREIKALLADSMDISQSSNV